MGGRGRFVPAGPAVVHAFARTRVSAPHGLAGAGANEFDVFLLEDVYRVALLGFVEGDDLFEIVVVEDEDAARWPAHRSIVFRKTFGRGILRVRIMPNLPNWSVM